MTWTQAIIVYAVCWWLLLFMALPFGVRRQEEPQPGSAPGAPEKTHLGKKCVVVTVLAVFVTWAIAAFVGSGLVSVK